MLSFKPLAKLRDYQQKSLDDLKEYIQLNPGKNPCVVVPTGGGKSHIIAGYCKDVISRKPKAKILMLTHVKELIEQNAEKLLLHWPGAPLGIYSAGLRKKDIEQITYAGIQSIAKKAYFLGWIDVIIVDEAHLINHKAQGSYRMLFERLKAVNPNLIIIGFTATPFRLGHGLITDDPAIFDDILSPVSIEELQYKGYLAKLKSKITDKKLSTDGVHKRGGEFIEKELQAAVNTSDNNVPIINEVIEFARKFERKHWLFFCTGVDHATAIKELLINAGITAEVVTGKTPKTERERILNDYKAGKIAALTNANVLTTGFDYPDIDLIVMLRPTMSPSLYIQMAGRGLRLKSHTDYCLVLDFAGVVERHGPITNVKMPTKAKEGGTAPAKECPMCGEIIHASLMKCPECGYEFPPNEKPDAFLHDDDIQGDGSKELEVNSWGWSIHTSVRSGKQMLKLTYFPENMKRRPIDEYLCVLHGGYTGHKAISLLKTLAYKAGVDISEAKDINELVKCLNAGASPTSIVYKKNGRYYDVIDRVFDPTIERERNLLTRSMYG